MPDGVSHIVRVEKIGDATLHLGDCLGVSLSGDVCITDPPYGLNVKTTTVASKRDIDTRNGTHYGRDWKPVHGDDRPFDPSHLLAFKSIVTWGANNYADKLPASPCWFAWDRKAGKAADSDITDCELAWVRGLPYKTVRLFRHMWAGFQRDSEVGEKHVHPTQKPVALFSWCIGFFPNAGTVVDPYMGAGACGVAAVRAGRSFVGCEIDQGHFDTACRRIEAAHRQPSMFHDPAPRKADLDAAYQRSMFDQGVQDA